MSPDKLGRAAVRKVTLLHAGDRVRVAIATIVESGLPALPVIGPDERFVGIFGEREFITALFPGYVGQLRTAAFVPQSLDELIERRLTCGEEPVSAHMNREKVAVGLDHSDLQLAEIFLHHRVLIVPVVDGKQRVEGVVTRSAFFEALVARFLERSS